MNIEKIEFRKTGFITRNIEIERRDDGNIILKCRIPLNMRKTSLPAYLRHYANERPESKWLYQRLTENDGWRSVSFSEAAKTMNSLTQSLLDLNLKAGQSLVILCENTIEHALVALAAMQASIPLVPLSPAFFLKTKSKTAFADRLEPIQVGAIFVNNSVQAASVLATLEPHIPVISVEGARPDHDDLLYSEASIRAYGQEVETAFESIDPDTPARFMFTSGSTGSPKPTIHTHTNMIAAIESNLMTNGFQDAGKVVRLDWMPWHHVVGTSILGITLLSGGSYYIDEGKPVGTLFSKTIDNLQDISPTVYFSMPAGYVMLVEELENDEKLSAKFFKNLEFMSYAGARLPDDIARRMQILAVKNTGYKLPFTCGYGATETGPGGAMVYWQTEHVGLIGLPQPGYDLKLVPVDEGRYAVWIRGKGVTPGYLGMPELNDEIFDDEGFIKMGDAATFVDPDNINEGLAFAGRLSEEFKLLTGTFVLGSTLRVKIMDAIAPIVQDVVVCGADKSYVAILAWLNVKAARAFLNSPSATLDDLIIDERILAHISTNLLDYNRQNPGSSTRIARFQLLKEPASFDYGEINDKNTINPQAVQRNRVSTVDALYEKTPSDAIIIV